jgi:F-type H+-transporting ATPase subunit a
MPATARIAIPLFLSLLVWVIFIVVGFKHQGPRYLKNSLFPPGVPGPLYILVAPIEFISTFLVRPLSLTVRLFANMLAGHILLVTFALLTEELIKSDTLALKPVAILPFFMLLFITAFEVLVGFLQAYIFAMLAGVYIGGAAHPEH